MTDRVAALTVVLDEDIRIDDVEFIVNAIKAIRHVQSVKPIVSNWEVHVAEERVRREIYAKIFDIVYPDRHKKDRE